MAVVLVVFVWTMFTDSAEDADRPPERPSSSTVPEPTGPRVLDPGAEPRQVLRLVFTEGEQVSFQVVTDLDVTQTSGDDELQVDTPAVIQTITMTVEQVHARGAEADISFEITAASVYPEDRFPQQTIDELNLGLGALVGIGGSGRISQTGEVVSFDYRYDGADPAVAESLDQMAGQLEHLTPSFPTEPLGVGARWVEETEAQLSGVTFSQATTYELTDITDGAVEYTSTIEQTADPQDLDLAEADESRLVSYSGSGSGSGLFTLSTLVAAGSTSMVAEQVIVVTSPGGAEMELTQNLTLELVIDVIW